MTFNEPLVLPRPRLVGRRVLLRAPRPGDRDDRTQWGAHAEIAHMYGGDPSRVTSRLLSAETVERWYQGVASDDLCWIIEADARCIGQVRLHQLEPANRRMRLAIGLFAPELFDHGYGTEAARCGEIPRAVKAILHDALGVRRHRDGGEWNERRVARELARLESRLDALLDRPSITRPDNRRLLGHLRTERDALFTFLRHPGVDATNWRAEQAIRPAVVNRKVWGDNRTPRGARTEEVLTSLMQTCRQRGVNVLDYLADIQRRPPGAAPILVPIRAGCV